MKLDLNASRLIRVRDQITTDPQCLELDDDFVSGRYEGDEFRGYSFCVAALGALDAGFIVLRTTPRPGTARVLYDITPAGEQVLGDGGTLDMFRASLGLDQPAGDRLMFVAAWPKGHRKQFQAATTPELRAKVTARRIDQFIATGGRE